MALPLVIVWSKEYNELSLIEALEMFLCRKFR